jgi:glutaredoxin 3
MRDATTRRRASAIVHATMDRCESHGLATGPDGLCVVCRRERGAEPAASPRLAIGVAAALLSVVLAAGALHMSRRPANDAPIAAVSTESANGGAARAPAPEPPPGGPPGAFAAPADRPRLPLPESPVAPPTPAQAPNAPNAPIAEVAAGPDVVDLAVARRAVTITMYTTTWCPRCKEARAWMAANGVSYTERDIEANDANEAECKRYNPKGSIPTTVVDGAVLIGFGERHFRDAIDGAARRRWAARR